MVVSGIAARKTGYDKHPPEGMIWMPEHDLLADFEMLQGYCFPDPGVADVFLDRQGPRLPLANSMPLWRSTTLISGGRATRTATACWRTWCVWDTGEDHSSRLIMRNAPPRWPFDFAPTGDDCRIPRTPQLQKLLV